MNADMSVDATNESVCSDLSMIIDDFISRKPDSKENKVPNITTPVSTSTPHCHKTRESIQTKVVKKLESAQNCGNQVPQKTLTSKNVGPIEQTWASNPFSKQVPTKNVDKRHTVDKDISMLDLDESLPKLDKPQKVAASKGIESYFQKNILPQKNVDKDLSMVSVNESFEDSFDRMCK